MLILKMGTHLAQSRASVRSFMGADGRADSHKKYPFGRDDEGTLKGDFKNRR